jgi:hypothetical protein
MMLLT